MLAPAQKGGAAVSIDAVTVAPPKLESRKAAPHEFLSENERKRQLFSEICTHRPTPLWKRIFDVVVASALLITLAPVLVLIALFIRITSGGPALFKQVRLGEMGREFVIYKFRTLHVCPNATSNHREFLNSIFETGSVVAKPDLSKRLIFGGALLRKSSLDELPQLINILLGEMSLIGPRPDVLQWDDYEPSQLRRFEVRPGVTGLWQVSGKNRLTFSQMIEKDVQYVNNRSLLLDLKISLKTIRLIVLQDNA